MNTSIVVQNLKCGGCANTILKKIEGIKGVGSLEVNLENSTVSFEVTNNDELLKVKEKLSSMGYPAVDDENSFVKKAQSYVSCAIGKVS